MDPQMTVTLEEYQMLKNEHPLVADIVSFPNCHINHLTPRTIDIDLVQELMQEKGMPAKERIEGPRGNVQFCCTRRASKHWKRRSILGMLRREFMSRDSHGEVRGS